MELNDDELNSVASGSSDYADDCETGGSCKICGALKSK